MESNQIRLLHCLMRKRFRRELNSLKLCSDLARYKSLQPKVRNLNLNSNISHQIIIRFNDLSWYQCWFCSSVLLQHVNNWLICVFLFFLNYFSPSHRPWRHWRSWQSSVLSSYEGAGLPPAHQQSAWQLQWSVCSDTLTPVNQNEHQNIKYFLELPHCLLLRLLKLPSKAAFELQWNHKMEADSFSWTFSFTTPFVFFKGQTCRIPRTSGWVNNMNKIFHGKRCKEVRPYHTMSSLTFSMLNAGTEVGVCRPMLVMPFWSRETFSLPLWVRVGMNTCDEWLLMLPARRLFHGVTMEPARLRPSPWMLCSSSANSASELLCGRKVKMLSWLPRRVLRGWDERVARRGWAGWRTGETLERRWLERQDIGLYR